MPKPKPSPNAWRDAIAKDLQVLEGEYGKLHMEPKRLLDVELVLSLMTAFFPGEDPALAWTILSGQPYPAIKRLPPDGRRAVAVARQRLSWVSGRESWERSLRQYATLPAPYPLYQVRDGRVTEAQTVVLPERKDAYTQALRSVPARPVRAARYAEPGWYRFYEGRTPHEVEIPARAVQAARQPVEVPDLKGHSERQPILVSLEELQAEADWMDENAAPGTAAHGQFWGPRLRDVDLQSVSADGLQPSGILTLDGLLHLIGMVGSGKSSLFTVLTVYLARRGHRVTIVQSDVASLLREQAIYDSLRHADDALLAVPLIGRSTRLTHLKRLHVSEALRWGPSLDQDHPAYRMLSTICPLDGFRKDAKPIKPGYEPCTALYPLSKGGSEEGSDSDADASQDTPDRRLDCPLMPVCPVHAPTRQLAEARIWLATPASLLASGPQQPLVPDRLRNMEMAVRSSDVVLVDEADLMQIQFDDRFAPTEVLVGGEGALLDRLATQVSRQIYRPGRPLVGKRYVLDRWLTAHNNLQRAVDRLYAWLREHEEVRWALSREETYIHGERLLSHVLSELNQRGVPVDNFKTAMGAFISNPLGREGEHDEPQSVWTAAVQAELFRMDSPFALARLQRWIREELPAPADLLTDFEVDAVSQRLLVALIVEVIGHSLHDVIVDWPAAAESLDLDRGTGGLFYDTAESLVKLVPEAPMGPVFGFQYFDSENTGDGELRFFRVQGVGRYLLHHLHDCLLDSHGIAGPHVILTSGTSWAPESWRYHLSVEPGMVLLPNRVDRTAETICMFEPLADPDDPGRHLSVSAIKEPENRILSLRSMVAELSRRRGFEGNGGKGKSMLDRELEQLDPDRKRILLVVGNYEEARAVGETLTELRGAPDEVLTLERDSSDDDLAWRPRPGKLLRSMLKDMPSKWQEAKFLVAPLLAIERGHNILVGQQAAIGSVYFLVRPMPVPGDPHTAVQQVNYWVDQYVDTLTGMSATEAGRHLRGVSQAVWRKALQGQCGYSELDQPGRTPLLWTQLVLVWQCIGRLLRGGVSARVHFIDAKWAEESAEGRTDTEASSMLLGFERILADALDHPDPAYQSIAEALYGPFAGALSTIRGVNRTPSASNEAPRVPVA
jgi:hypothetical protein